MTTEQFVRKHKGECRHIENSLDYPNGKMVAITIIDSYNNDIICLISFTNGYMGSYSYRLDELFKEWWNGLKQY